MNESLSIFNNGRAIHTNGELSPAFAPRTKAGEVICECRNPWVSAAEAAVPDLSGGGGE